MRDSVILNTPLFPIFSQPHPRALSYHNHFRNIYANNPPHPSTTVPPRDIAVFDYHLLEGDSEELLEKYPEAIKIRDAAGARGLL